MASLGEGSVVRCDGITKFFGGVRALADVSFALRAGEIVGLVGENGAGKSTLTKILSGLLHPDQGQIHLGQTTVNHLDPRAARSWGIETVYQTLELCENLDASGNVLLGQEPTWAKFGPIRFIDRPAAVRETAVRLAQLGVVIPDMTVAVRRLSGGQRQAVAVARATIRGNRLVIFDEPTAALGLRQKKATLDLIAEVARRGVAVLFISHNLDEVLLLADRVVALRLGEVTLDAPKSALTRAQIELTMSGLAPATT